jgi:DTW domain-containing protein YfiP
MYFPFPVVSAPSTAPRRPSSLLLGLGPPRLAGAVVPTMTSPRTTTAPKQQSPSPAVQASIYELKKSRGPLSPSQLEFLGLKTQEEYRERLEARTAAKDAVKRIVEDPSTSPADKYDAQVRYTVTHGKALCACRTCWLSPGACVCPYLRRFGSSRSNQVVLWMHDSEYGRASNSGSILLQSYEGTELLVRGLREHDARLREMIEDPTVTTAFLFPSNTALTADQLKERAARETGGRIRIVGVDATWGQARKLMGSLPDRSRVVEVKLSSQQCLPGGRSESLLAPVRRYGGDFEETGRVSTLEAIVGMLRELGEPEETCAGLLDNMMIKVDSLRIQNHCPPVYGRVAPGLVEKYGHYAMVKRHVEAAAVSSGADGL